MALAELPTRTTAPTEPTRTPRASVTIRSRVQSLTLEHVAYIALFALALLTRFWGLGDRALHHDETHHAYYSWLLFMGRGYTHDPLLHGPFLYHIGALIYFLFGDTNTTARVGVALFGSVLVVLPYFIRRELGRGAALLAATYLLISPAFLYISRFIRHDMYAVVFEMLAFAGMVRYASTRRAGWLYLVAASLGLMFATMETFFLYVAMFAPLIALIFFWRVWKPGVVAVAALGLLIVALVFVLPGKPTVATGGSVDRVNGPYVCPTVGVPIVDNPIRSNPGPIFGWGALETADNNYALCVRNQPDDQLGVYFAKLWQFTRHPAILSALVLSVGSVLALYVGLWRRRDRDGSTLWQRARSVPDATLDVFASLAVGWRALIAFVIFFGLYALFFSAFFTNVAGIVTGATGSLLYWLAQHNVQRGNQPAYYYLLLLVIYEPLVLLWSIIGLVMAVVIATKRVLKSREPQTETKASSIENREAQVVQNGEQEATLTEPQHNGNGNHAASNGFASLGFPVLDWPFALPLILAYWSVATVALYSWAGEKMPWLTIHVALPLVLLGAWAFARALRWAFAWVSNVFGVESQDITARTEQRRAFVLYFALFAAVCASAFVLMTNITAPNNTAVRYTGLVPPLFLVVVVLLTVGYGLARNFREALGALALSLALIGSVYTVRSAYQLSYLWGDTPREMMVFVQTSPDMARVLGQLEQASIRRTSGLNMKIWYDNETIWNWYLRRYTNAQQQQPALTQAPPPDVQAVLMLQENIDNNRQNLQQLQGFRIQRYPLRWWFPEDQMYRMPSDWRTAPFVDDSPLLMRLLRNPLDGQAVGQTWQYLMYRTLPAPLGSTDMVLAARPALADEIGLGTGVDAASLTK